MEKHALQVSVIINATAPRVWEAITEPEQIKHYFFGTQVETDWKIGSPITFSGSWEGKPYCDKGTILDIKRGERLSYSYWSGFSGLTDAPENYQTVTYALETKGDIHEIRNTGTALLQTLNVYVPPAYSKDGEPLPGGRRK